MVWILLGPPGAGKGTQAKLLGDHLRLPHVSTGDLLRGAVAGGTELGRRARSFMESGELVPDDLILGMVRERLSEETATGGCILDGYPRNLAQGRSLDKMLADIGQKIGCVINLAVPDEELVRRIAGRAADEGRTDDAKETVHNRLRVYREQTEPLVEYYGGRKVLRAVDGVGSVEEIQDRIRGIAESVVRTTG